MTTVIKPPRLDQAIYAENGGLFTRLVEQLDNCSAQFTRGCLDCPHLKICVAWWDLHVCEYLSRYMLKQERLESLMERFQQIRTGQYKGNGHKRNGGRP